MTTQFNPVNPAHVAVIVPTLRQHGATHLAVGDLLREPVSVVIVDHAGDYEPAGHETVLCPGENLGWARGCNYGLAHAHDRWQSDFYIVLNNDVRLSARFVECLLFAFSGESGETDAECGPVGLAGPEFVKQLSQLDAAPSRPAIRRVHAIDGCCMMFPRSVYERLGPLDGESFGFYGFGVDVDYSIRVKQIGHAVAVSQSARLWHHESRTAHEVAGGRAAYRSRARAEGLAGLVKKYGRGWRRLSRAVQLP